MKEHIVREEMILIDYLRKEFTKLSKNNIKSLLSKEMVTVNNSVQTRYDYLVKKGDKIVIRETKIKVKRYQKDINIIYEDDDLLVINKPAGLLTIATNKEKEFTLYHFASNYIKEKNKYMPVAKVVLKKYPKMLEAMENRHIRYNKTIEYIREKELRGEVFVIRPPRALNIGGTEKNPEELERVYQIGRRTAVRKLDELKAFLKAE